MIQIKNRFTDAVICEYDVPTLRDAVIEAVKSGANLSNADLSNANLSNANLYRAYLYRADLSNANLYRAYLYRADLSNANLSGANLSNANLSNADLSNANLSNANLSNANLYGEILEIAPVQLQTEIWSVVISESYMKIGCQRHTHEEWKEFDDNAIAAMESRALAWWKQWKKPLLDICKLHKKQSLEHRKAREQS